MNQPTIGATHSLRGDLATYNGWTYTYDVQNRLTKAVKGTTPAYFFYDGKNRQVGRSIAGVITLSVWDDWELIEEYGPANALTAKYLQGAHGPIKNFVNNIYYYQDSLGSTTHIADASGALLESYRYNLNGTPTYWTPSNSQLPSCYGIRDLFSGERYIPELGLYDLRNRYYSPDLGPGDVIKVYVTIGEKHELRSNPVLLFCSQ